MSLAAPRVGEEESVDLKQDFHPAVLKRPLPDEVGFQRMLATSPFLEVSSSVP